MKAFLSFSSKDRAFVRQVASSLGSLQCEFDERTFEHTFNVQAIRQALTRSDLYVFFLSADSITSTFVAEEQKAALEARGKGIIRRVIIFSLDSTSYRALPDWMREINIVQHLSSPKTCARRIQSVLIAIAAEKHQDADIYIGREEEEKALRRALSAAPDETPIAIHAVGHYGIGRRTFVRKTLSKLFPRIDIFVEVTLSQYEGVEELYRSLYALHRVASLEQISADFEDFSRLSLSDQVEELAVIIEEMCANYEFIFVVDDGGVYDEAGAYQSFLLDLINRLAILRQPALAFVQTRMMPLSKRAVTKISYHTYLRPLPDEQIKELLSFSLKKAKIDFTSAQLDRLAELLDGHPFNVRFAVQFIENYGIESLIADPSDLVEWKRRRAEDFLKRISFGQLEVDIIAILNEYRYVASEALVSILVGDPADIARALRRLEEFCCIERREGYFHVAAPIREAARRDKRFDKTDSWRQSVAKSMCESITDYKNEDHVSVALLQSATIAAAQGDEGPRFLANFILPSHLLRIARDYYDRGKRTLCMEFCRRAFDMKNRLTREGQVEILRLWGLSAIRSNEFETYQTVLRELDGYSSRVAERIKLFLEGFHLRLNGKLDDAEEKFLAAWRLSRDNQSVNRELASLYCKQRRYGDAEAHARSAYQIAPTNPYIIDILAETLLGKLGTGLPVDLKEIDSILSELKVYGDAPGSSFFLIREAQRQLRNRDYKGALSSVTRAVDRTPALLAPYFIRAEVHLAMTDVPAAERDLQRIDELLSEAGGFSEGDEARVHELEVRILIEKQQYKGAKEKIERSAFLPRAAKRRLLEQLARVIGFSPGAADASMKAWAKQFNG